MDLGFWGNLWKESDARLLLRQAIPEVCVFRGFRLDGWYHNNASGLVVCRKQSAAAAVDENTLQELRKGGIDALEMRLKTLEASKKMACEAKDSSGAQSVEKQMAAVESLI